jgi:hypothetical protein
MWNANGIIANVRSLKNQPTPVRRPIQQIKVATDMLVLLSNTSTYHLLGGRLPSHRAWTSTKADLGRQWPSDSSPSCACRGISCRKNTGYHMMDPKIRTQGAVRVRSRLQRNTATEASRRRKAQHIIERDTELYPGLGPSW